jgi:outer membrane protein insertion porin family
MSLRYTLLYLTVLMPLPMLGASEARAQLATENRSVVSRIAIDGNQRIEQGTILSYLGIREGNTVGRYELDQGIRDLFATGFFADVDITLQRDGMLKVTVLENPMVNRVEFEGNDHLEDEELSKEVQLKSRVIYTRNKIQADVARLLELYQRSGRFSAKIEPKLIMRPQNRVDIVYEIEEGPVAKIADIRFIGNKVFASSDLEEVIRSREDCWYCFLSDFDKYDPDRLAYDQEMLRKFYTTQGYADFQVKSSIAELTTDKREFYITFTVDEGKQYTLNKVDFESGLKGTDPEALRAKVLTVPGDEYNSDAIETSIDNLVGEMGNQGYAFVDIDPQLKRNEKDGTIDLTYVINEGPRVYVERIDITGNVRTLDEVVRREFRLAEGDPFSTEKLQRTEQRLKNLGFFENVKLSNAPGSAPDKTDVKVEVSEASTGEISLGAGFSTVDGPLADFGIREKNLLGRGQDLRLHAMLAAQRQQFDLGFTEPYFLNRELAAGFDLFKTSQDFRQQANFDRESTGGKLRMGYTISENLRHDIYYSLAETSIRNVNPLASRFIRDQQGTNLTSLVGQSLTYDSRNNKFDPTGGFLLGFDFDVAGLGGNSKFLRPELRGSYYYNFAPDWTFMLAGVGGYMYALSDQGILIQDRFFVGSRNMRGFDDAGIGPRDLSTGDALGGNTYYVGTIEQSFPLGLPEELGFRGAVFTDIGTLYDVDSSGPTIADDPTIRVASGVGLSWRSPFGPVRLDLSKALVKETYDNEQLMRFSFGTRF